MDKMIASIRLDGQAESLVFDGAVDKPMFSAYLDAVLLHTLKDGDILVSGCMAGQKCLPCRKGDFPKSPFLMLWPYVFARTFRSQGMKAACNSSPVQHS